MNMDSVHTVTLSSIVKEFRPDLTVYEQFYQKIHQDPELSGREASTAQLVADHLHELKFKVCSGIGGHGVLGILRNGLGPIVMIRAELDALPILEQTDLPYRSTKRMIDRYGNERPVMHACGHDMNMAALLGASALLKAAAQKWSRTLITLFQPDEEETGGARAMVDGGLYNIIPEPEVLLGQHLVPLAAGKIAIRSGPVLAAADAVSVRIIGGPRGGINPQHGVDPIPLAMRIMLLLIDTVPAAVAPEEATVACWGFHAGVPGNDYVAHADFLLDVKTWKSEVQQKAHRLIEDIIREECKIAETPEEPIITFSPRAPLTNNSKEVTGRIKEVFEGHFTSDLVEMPTTRACEDFSWLASRQDRQIPYGYWNFGGGVATTGEVATNHSPFFAPVKRPTLEAATDAMALAALAFLCGRETEQKRSL